MFFNLILGYTQKFFNKIYNHSFVLKNLDWLIFINILFVILSSTFAQSDTIGYFAIFTMVLTSIKLLTKNGEKIIFNKSDTFLLLYFLFILISLAGSSLFMLSLKGFLKYFIYLGFYISFVHYLKNNKDKLKYVINKSYNFVI